MSIRNIQKEISLHFINRQDLNAGGDEMKFEIKSDDMHTKLFIDGEDVTDQVAEFTLCQKTVGILNLSITFLEGISAEFDCLEKVSEKDLEGRKQCQYSLTKPKPPKQKRKLFRIKR